MTAGVAGPYFTISQLVITKRNIVKKVSKIKLPPGDAHACIQQTNQLQPHWHGALGFGSGSGVDVVAIS
jgi:hypothetical protein